LFPSAASPCLTQSHTAFRFSLSLRDVEELLLERGVVVAYETIRCWCDKFGADFARFECLPGAGPHLTPRLLAAFGEQRERFRHAAELQKYSGIAPVTERSGKKCWVH
jgi:transposase